jgi:HSP20 family molecular chaperone IbpA
VGVAGGGFLKVPGNRTRERRADDEPRSAERTVQRHAKAHSEFSYGSFARTVRLPAGIDAGQVTANYTAGILEVTVPVKEPAETRQIPVEVSKEA